MSTRRSEEFYFPGGDLVLKIENTLFRVHRDVLARYSGFFHDMFSTPTSDEKEGTSDEHPLRIPGDLCKTAQTFTAVCEFIYPKKLGELPKVQIQDVDAWELVLEASLALQMLDVQTHITSAFQRNTAAIASEAVRFLSWVTRPEIKCDELKLGCIRALVHRRLPLLPAEAAVLGTKTTSELMYIREKVRTLLSTRSTPIAITAITCASHSDCQDKFFRAIDQNMTREWMHSPDQGKHDIFRIENIFACQACTMSKDYIASTLKYTSGALDKEILQCAKVVGLHE